LNSPHPELESKETILGLETLKKFINSGSSGKQDSL